MITPLIFALLLQPAEALPACDQAAADRGIQADLNQCAYRDYMVADAALNAQWKRTAAAMKKRDADFAPYAGEDTRPGFFESLLEAQRAWLAYRDAHCRVDGYAMRGGSMEPMVAASCKTALTEARTQQLKDLADPAY